MNGSPPPAKQFKMASSSSSGSAKTPFSGLSLASSPPSKISLGSGLKMASSAQQQQRGIGGTTSATDTKTVKKLVIKNAKTPSASSTTVSSAEYANNALQTLVRAARAILSTPPEPIPESLQALYSLCEGLVSASSSSNTKSGLAQTLYDRVRIEVERKVGESGNTLRQLDAADGEAWLAELEKTWKAFNDKMLMVRSVFLHLDRTYVLQTPHLLSIWDMGVDIFRHRIVENSEIGSRMTNEMLQLINRERNGEAISRPLLTMLIGMLSSISTISHATVFVTPFIASSNTYYQQEGQTLLQTSVENATTASEMGIPTYLQHVQRRLSEEAERCDLVIGSALKGQIVRVVEERLIGEHVALLLSRGLPKMLDEEKIEDLSSLYSFLSRVGARKQMQTAFGEYVKARGSAIVADASRDDSMVESLIAFQTLVSTALTNSFSNDQDYRITSREAFKTFINTRQNKPAEMIAKYIDAKMRAGNKAMSDDELEKTFRNVLILFRYCQGKDIFEAFYKKDFAKRLLLNKSASSDAEKSMLLKLKEECGPGFTAKLETMAKDIDLSGDMMKSYKEHLDANGTDSILSVNILTAGNWPTYHQQPCRIPENLQPELDRFNRFYKAKYAGRSLSYMHSLDQCTLKVEFKKGPGGGRKELNVSLHQAVVLLLFGDVADGDKISYKDIQTQTGLEHKELARTLQSLSVAKHKILIKYSKGKDVSKDDEFSFNSSFKDDKFRLKINQIQQKETVEEAKQTTTQVLLDRQSHLQLVIVRILKSRKTIKHQELVMEVVGSLKERFRVDPPEIKKAIDSLIERDYMERAEGTRDTYNYLA